MSDFHCHICWKKIPFFLRASLLGRSKKKRSKLFPAHDDIRHNAAILVMNHLGSCIRPIDRKAFISDSFEKRAFKEMAPSDLPFLPDCKFRHVWTRVLLEHLLSHNQFSFRGFSILTRIKLVEEKFWRYWIQAYVQFQSTNLAFKHQLIALFLVRG